MKNVLLVGLACVLLAGVVIWLLLGRSSAPAPVPVGASGLATKTAAPERPAEKLSSEPVAKSEPVKPAPAQPEAAKPAAQPRQGTPTPVAAEFLPFPNAGESDFKLKYEGLDLDKLAKAKAALQQQLNQEQSRLAEDRFARGLFEERILDLHNPSQVKEVKPPEGLGDVRASQKTEMQPDGTMKNKTTFLTQSENPEFFGHVAELNYLLNAWKQSGGH
jgi:hypothetical protein